MGSDDVGVDGLPEHAQAVIEIDGPKRLAPFGESVTTPDVVDEDVEAVVAALDERSKLPYFGGDFVVDSYGYAVAAGGGDQVGSFFDGFALAGLQGTFLRVSLRVAP